MTNAGTKLLNEVQKLLIAFANEQGISLRTEFGTVEEFKRFVISFTFKVAVDAGLTVRTAYDLVMGNGAYDKLANDLWESFQTAS